MNSEISLPHSQAPATCPYLGLQQSSLWLSINFNIILQSFILYISIKISYWLYVCGITYKSYGNNIHRNLRYSAQFRYSKMKTVLTSSTGEKSCWHDNLKSKGLKSRIAGGLLLSC
jgi:hypothetical protein